MGGGVGTSKGTGKSMHKLCRNYPLAIYPLVSPLISLATIGRNYIPTSVRANFWEGDATKHFSVKKRVFSEQGGGNSVNQGFGKDFYRKGNSVKRFGPFTGPPDSEN